MSKFINSFKFNNHTYYYYDLKKVFEYFPLLKKLPYSLKILLESNLRNISQEDSTELINLFQKRDKSKSFSFYANRVIMQESKALPILIDIASIRNRFEELNKDVKKVKPQIMVDVILDTILDNQEIETKKEESYELIKWFDNKFKNFSVIFSDRTSTKKVNLEYLSTLISSKEIDEKIYLFPELVVGTDFHSTIINALGVFGYKSESIDVSSVILGSSIFLKFPSVVGIEIKGSLSQGVSISDIRLSLETLLENYNLHNKIIEFYGDAVKNLSIEHRVSLLSLINDTEALCGYFPIDENSISYIQLTRDVDATLIKEYYKNQGLYLSDEKSEYDENILFDFSLIKPVVKSLKKPYDKIYIKDISSTLNSFKKGNFVNDNDIVEARIEASNYLLDYTLFIQAGLVAKKAVELGLNINSNIKRVFILESQFLKNYLEKLKLLEYLERLGFILSTNSEEKQLVQRVSLDVEKFNLNVVSISSSEKNIEKNNSLIKSNWQMSPALIIVYCLKGNLNFDITSEAIIADVYLSDIWPSWAEVNENLDKVDNSIFEQSYKNIFDSNNSWKNVNYRDNECYIWNNESLYIQKCNLYEDYCLDKIEIENAKILALFQKDIKTNYIYPSGQIPLYSSSANYLMGKGLKLDEFDTFENREMNFEIMLRGTLSNISLKNIMVKPKEGGYTKDFDTNEIISIYDFSLRMKEKETLLVLFVEGKYGNEDNNSWAAKGIKFLGVKVVIAQSFDDIQRFNLIKMGILPLEFIDEDIESLKIKGDELITIKTNSIKPNSKIELEIKRGNELKNIEFQSKLETKLEVEYYKNSGVLSYLCKNL